MMKLLYHHIHGVQHLFLMQHGAKIKWVDIDPNTFIIRNNQKTDNKKTKAIIIVHLYGMPVNIREIITKRKIIVIEDCAQSLGSSINKKTGSFEYLLF